MKHLKLESFLLAGLLALACARGGTGKGVSVTLFGDESAVSTPRDLHMGKLLDSFLVAIRNESKKPVDLYADGSSWGDDSLLILLKDTKGKVTIVRRGPLAYTKNAPSTFRLQPGETGMRNVYYSSSDWSGFETYLKAHAGSNPIQVRMRAVMVQDATGSRNRSLWGGRVESPEVSVRIWR